MTATNGRPGKTRAGPGESGYTGVTDYENIGALRQALSVDDPDRRAEAYGAVMQHDVEPSQILQTPPDEQAVNRLVEAGVLGESEKQGPPQAERWEQVISLLEEIAANTGGGS